jgi:Outer membrane protein beta-barrel domain
MKTTTSYKFTAVFSILMFCAWGMNAQVDSTKVPVDTIPVATPAVAPAPPAPAPAEAAPAAEDEKTKTKKDKEGFNAKTRFGIRGGGIVSKSDYESNATEDPEFKLGADLAILCSIPIGGGFFNLQPELHWMQKGFKTQDATTGAEYTSTLEYIELPLLARVNFGGSIRLFAFAGPSAGFLIGGTWEDENGEQDATDVLEGTEFSGHIGLGAGIGTFEVDIRYMAGLSDISASESLGDVKNSSFGIGLTLKF